MVTPSAPPDVQRMVIERFPDPVTARTLSPNGRAHWATRKKAVDLVHVVVARDARDTRLQPMAGKVILQPTFVYPVKRPRDDDNLSTGVLKAVRDALVRGGYLQADDMDHLEQRRPIVQIEKGRRALILEFWSASR